MAKLAKAILYATRDAVAFFLLCSLVYFFFIPILIIFEWVDGFKRHMHGERW